MTLRLALIGGPMYDGQYQLLDGLDVEIVVHADHPTLNRTVGEMLARGERIDVLSTHGKYAPSQAEWLRPLEPLLDDGALAVLAPDAIELCRVDGDLLAVPRMIDARILWTRADLVDEAPDTWADVLAVAEAGRPFGFPGRESGLFGTFFELVVGHGGRLLTDGVVLDTDIAVEAVDLLARLAAAAPDDVPDWHYDQVDDALLEGRVAMAGAWPGATSLLRQSRHPFEPHRYPTGPHRRVTYAGCHAWAIPTTCGDLDGAIELVGRLCGENAHRLDAAAGTVCAHVGAFGAVEPVDDVDQRRLEMVREAIADQMITYPPLVRFPEIEDAGWEAIRDVLTGTTTPTAAVSRIEAVAARVLEDGRRG